MGQSEVNVVFSILSAYSWTDVKQALRRFNRMRGSDEQEKRKQTEDAMASQGWAPYLGDVPEGFEWRTIGRTTFVRDPKIPREDASRVTVHGSRRPTARQSTRKRTDTSVRKVEDIKCPRCGSEMFKEGICAGCEEGRRGLKVRLLCGDCDYTLAL